MSSKKTASARKTSTPKTSTPKPEKTIFRSVSDQFAQAIHRVLMAKTKNGDALPHQTIAEELQKSREFGVSNLAVMKLMVAQALSEGAVPDAESVAGRAGGAYLVSAREAWNAKVAELYGE